ncbi:putative Phosphatidylinositol N-acetylglucosaminyltransferase [Mesotoga infera]|nr:putative Phosphatidylinositol N-acetylglucosaminyltransferase [Mesotoga infera]
MRILHFVSSFAPGGAEVYVRNLACEMKEKGIDQSIYALDDARDVRKDDKAGISFQEEYIELLKKNSIGWGFMGSKVRNNPVQGIVSIKKIIEKEKPDVIHSHVSGISAYLVFANSRVPNVYTHHSTPVRHPALHKHFLRKRIARYIAISDSGKQALLDIGIPSPKIAKIHNGIPLEQFKSERRISEDVSTLLAVGRLQKPKNYPLMLRSFSEVVCKCKEKGIEPPVLKIVGEGELKDNLKKLCDELVIQDRVIFLGIRRDIPKLLGESDIFVMSSDWEGFSIALIEALASGIPIVATDVGGNAEIIENGVSGLLTKPGDEDDFAEKITRLIENQDLRCKFSEKASERSSLFSIENAAARHIEVYESIMDSRATT